MKKKRMKKFQLHKYIPFKDKEGNLILMWEDFSREDEAIIWPASGKVQVAQYGLRLNYVMNMNYYGDLDINEEDMVLYANNKYLIKSVKKLGSLEQGLSQDILKKTVTRGGLIVQTQARLLITSDSGELARSIKLRTTANTKRVECTVYSNSEHAAYYELGTGPNGQKSHAGISPLVTPRYSQRGWMIPADAMSVDKAQKYRYRVAMKDGKVIGYYTNGQMARPFMYPALKNHEKLIAKESKKFISQEIKKVVKK